MEGERCSHMEYHKMARLPSQCTIFWDLCRRKYRSSDTKKAMMSSMEFQRLSNTMMRIVKIKMAVTKGVISPCFFRIIIKRSSEYH